MNWLILIIAGLCETAFAFCLGKTKLVDGTEFWAWIAGFAFFYVLSAVLLAKATQTIPIGIAYPVWTRRSGLTLQLFLNFLETPIFSLLFR